MDFGYKDASIGFGKKILFDDLTLDFPKGKITTIIGQNGCGKSSLFRIYSRAVNPLKGEMIYQDKKIKEFSRKELAKKIAYLPQVHYSPDDINVKTLVSYGRYPYLKFGHGLTIHDKEIIDDSIARAGLKEIENQKVQTLSGGERQRAWIAMTIAQEPEILMLDEPITYLDVSYQMEVLELIKELNKTKNITIVMVLHDLNLAAKFSDWLMVLHDKKLYKEGPSKEVLTEKMLSDVFNIKSVVEFDQNDSPFFIPIKTNRKDIKENEK